MSQNEITRRAIFVFGSNLAGRHGAGAAQLARWDYKAEPGVGIGRTGNAYAIPTLDENVQKTLTVSDIKVYVDAFLEYARRRPDDVFLVTRIGCGLAGFRDEEIAPLFRNAPANCSLAPRWREIIVALGRTVT